MQENRIKSLMALHGESQEQIAQYLGISPRSFRDKLKGKLEFKQNEIILLKNHFNLSSEDVDTIFFSD